MISWSSFSGSGSISFVDCGSLDGAVSCEDDWVGESSLRLLGEVSRLWVGDVSWQVSGIHRNRVYMRITRSSSLHFDEPGRRNQTLSMDQQPLPKISA